MAGETSGHVPPRSLEMVRQAGPCCRMPARHSLSLYASLICGGDVLGSGLIVPDMLNNIVSWTLLCPQQCCCHGKPKLYARRQQGAALNVPNES